MWRSGRSEIVVQAQLAKEILCFPGIAEMLCWSRVQGEESKERNTIFSSLSWTPILFFLYITGVLCICICCAIQHGTTAPFKKYMVKHVLERTLSQASTKQTEMHHSEKGNYSEITYKSCRWMQYVVEWLTRKHSRWPPNSTWTIWYNKTWGIVLINVAVFLNAKVKNHISSFQNPTEYLISSWQISSKLALWVQLLQCWIWWE